MNYTISNISEMISGKLILQGMDKHILNIVYDSRKISYPEASIFFAFISQNNNGHYYVNDAYQKGIRNFVISDKINSNQYPEANFIQVNDTLEALQIFAKNHREKFEIPVIAITGSNGKTILKEWLNKSLLKTFKVVQSPNSFNSQIGVPLSLLQLNETHEIAIIEAGISQKGEMTRLQKMIQPTLGILTNIGDAHNIGFENNKQKVLEKCHLFKNTKHVIFNNDDTLIKSCLDNKLISNAYAWGLADSSFYKIIKREKSLKSTQVTLEINEHNEIFNIPFTNKEFVDLSLHYITCLLTFNQNPDFIKKELNNIDLLPNRLQISEGDNNCILINDSYSADMASLQLAFEYQDQHNKDLDKVFIFSEFDQQLDKVRTYSGIAELIKQKKISTSYGIGIEEKYQYLFKGSDIHFFKNTANLSRYLSKNKIKDACILIKGARRFKLERILEDLTLIVHQAVLETNLSALENNLNVYRGLLDNKTKIMAVIKADAYGSGSVAMAEFLQQKEVDYLAVALIDEAIQIRKSGCTLPIMVFNIQDENLHKLWEYNLEPEVYSLALLKKISDFAATQTEPLNIHIKVDTGMHRLGIKAENIDKINGLIEPHQLNIKSILSHIAASDNSKFDTFTKSQFDAFNKMYKIISSGLNYKPMRHILNTGGIIRFPDYQYEMVRIGLGLYGIDATQTIHTLLTKVHTLKARILQIKDLAPGESTGYNRSGMVRTPTKIAIIGLGYADGILRYAGNGNVKIYLNGIFCPTIGDICMDVMMIDVSEIMHVENYDEVEIFGLNTDIETFAKACQTITYEIISRISPRVKRIYTYN